MATLLDKINQRKTQAKTPTGPTNVAETLRQKATGKVTSTAGAKGPSLGTDIAAKRGKEASRQLQQQGGLEMAAIGQQSAAVAAKEKLAKGAIRAEQDLGIEAGFAKKDLAEAGLAADEALNLSRSEADTYRRIGEMNNQSSLALNDLANRRGVTIDNIFSSFDRANLKLTDDKERFDLGLAADALALQDKKYLHQLDMIGKERRLDNELSFKEESMRVILGQGYSDFIDEIGFKEAFNKDNREFEVELQSLTDQELMTLTRKQISADNKMATMQAWATALSGTTQAAGMAASQGAFDSDSPPTSSPRPGAEVYS